MGVCPDRRVVVRSINADQTDGAWGSAQTETEVPFLQKKKPPPGWNAVKEPA